MTHATEHSYTHQHIHLNTLVHRQAMRTRRRRWHGQQIWWSHMFPPAYAQIECACAVNVPVDALFLQSERATYSRRSQVVLLPPNDHHGRPRDARMTTDDDNDTTRLEWPADNTDDNRRKYRTTHNYAASAAQIEQRSHHHHWNHHLPSACLNDIRSSFCCEEDFALKT